MQRWKTLARNVILNHGKFLTVENHTVELPDGRVIDDWPWVITPNYIDVAVITEDNRFLCSREIKYGVGEPSLATVGGYIEPGEAPLEAAKRELLEESGYQAAEWQSLGSYIVDARQKMYSIREELEK